MFLKILCGDKKVAKLQLGDKTCLDDKRYVCWVASQVPKTKLYQQTLYIYMPEFTFLMWDREMGKKDEDRQVEVLKEPE